MQPTMRDRRAATKRQAKQEEEEALAMPDETREERMERRERRITASRRKGYLYYMLFFVIFLGLPLFFVIRSTPFFVVDQLRCRLGDKLWSDATVVTLEARYNQYFSDPPLYGTDAYNRSLFWGTYEPSRIFAMKSRTEQPITVGIAWYDEERRHPLRHIMPFVHNKVNAPRSVTKKGRDPEVMQIKWIVHDGLHYGKQTINDAGNRLELEVEFLKNPTGEAWDVRVRGTLSSPKPLTIVLYVLNGDTAEPIVVGAPDGHNDGDWSPTLTSRLQNYAGEKEPFVVRVVDRHNPLFDTEPWHIYGLQTPADEAFALRASDVPGATPEERAVADGGGVVTSAYEAEEQRRQRVDLRDLPTDAYSYITRADQTTFRGPAEGIHNMIVLRKSYSADFTLEVSLSPAGATSHQNGALSTCQLANTFRRREKAIHAHARKIFRPMTHKRFNASGGLYENLASHTIGETFGSLSFTKGRYQIVSDPTVDASWDERGRVVALWSADLVQPSTHVASALAAIGSRTDEAFGQEFLSGLQLLFLGRWNKEIVKDVLASWLVGAQDPASGFIPSRASFTKTVQSLTPRSLRVEHPTVAAPPTILLGLQELLNEMERKASRTASRRVSKKKRKVRNTPEYVAQEQASDKAFLEHILPSLRRWRAWWHQTQCGALGSEELARTCSAATAQRRPLEQWPAKPTGMPEDQLAYRWRSRDGHRLQASGMEDYPRPVCEGEHQWEAHVDLFSWIALLSSIISRVEVGHLGHDRASVSVDWEAHLNALHWDAEQGRYADRVGCAAQGFSRYTGYVNLYPVLLGVVRADLAKVAATVKLAQSELLTDYGLMSVSYDSVRRAREERIPHSNLWMGYVWPSTNLMLLHAIKSTYMELFANTGSVSGIGAQELGAFYEQLRVGQVETIRGGRRWWEYFSPVDGRGEGSKTYIGTRSLILGSLYDFS